MFNKIATLVLVLPLVSALQLVLPAAQITTNDDVTITWTTSSGDPATFDLELVNEAFHATYAVKATIQASDGKLTFEMPVVNPGSGYSLQATAVGNITNVLSSVGPFSVGAAISSSSSSSSSPSSSGSGSSSGGSSTSQSSLAGGPPPSSSGGFGHTVSSSQPQSSSPVGSQTGSSPSPSGSQGSGGGTFNAASKAGTGSLVATFAFAAAAGAVLIGC